MSKGCITTISAIVALSFIGSMAGQCSMGNPNAAAPVSTEGVAVTIAGKPLSNATIFRAVDTQKQQMAQFMGAVGPDQEAGMVSQALAGLLKQTAVRGMAEKAGVDFSEAAITKFFNAEFDRFVKSSIDSLKAEKKLKEGATQAEIDKAFEGVYQKTPSAMKTEQLKNLLDALKDPARKDDVLAGLSEPLLLEKEKASITLDDNALKQSYDTYTVKKILLLPNAQKNPEQEAKKILDEIKGGLKFEAAMNKYSQEPPLPGKTVSENTATVMGKQLDEPEFSALKLVKPGEVSLPSPSPQGLVIYKLVSVKSDLPADFEKKKDEYRKNLIEEKARGKISRDADQLVKSSEVRWQNKGIEVLYELGQLGMSSDGANRTAKLKELSATAKKLADDSDVSVSRFATLGWYASLSQLQFMAGEDEKKTLRADLKAAIAKLLATTEDVKLRLRLVDLAAEDTDKETVSDNLYKAALYNNDVTPTGQSTYAELQTKLRDLQAKNLVKPEAVKMIEAELQRWRKDKVAYEKAEADARAKAEAEEKAQKEKAKTAAKAKS